MISDKSRICNKCGIVIEPMMYHNCVDEVNAFNNYRKRLAEMEKRIERVEKMMEQHIRLSQKREQK